MMEIRKIALVFLLSISFTSSKIAPIREYQPHNDVTSYLAISEDLRAMDDALAHGNAAGFQQARDIYTQGAFSDPFTIVKVHEGLPFALSKGTTLTGTDNAGKPITVVVAFNSYKAGDTSIQIVFRSDPPCRMSGDPNPELTGCLVSDGDLVAEGQTKKIRYSYMLTDIRNYHTIQNFSRKANSKFKPNGNTHAKYFREFQPYVDFFGSADFADQIIMAAFNHKTFVSKHLKLDFVGFNGEERRSTIVHTAAFLTISLFVVEELDTALTMCENRCGSSGCNQQSIRSVDAAVALYTGSVFNETSKGNLLYGLADQMCAAFRTCGPKASEIKGLSKVNREIFQEFNAMQKNLDSSHCLEAKVNKETIVRKLVIPLVQATLLAVYIDEKMGNEKSKADRMVFATSILPLLFRCDPEASVDVIKATNPLAPSAERAFEPTKKLLESMYRCLDISCQDVGGIWDPETGDYKEGAESCDVSQASSADDASSGSTQRAVLISLLVLIVLALLGCYLASKRNRSKDKKRSRSSYRDDKHDKDDDSDDSDNDSVELKHTIT